MKTYRALLLCLLAAAYLAAQGPAKHPQQPPVPSHSCDPAQLEIKPGVERWPIKTSLPPGADPTQTKRVVLADVLALEDAAGVHKNDSRFQSARLDMPVGSGGWKEGDLLTLRGWLHLVATESDGDYHIQISDSQDSGDHCLIVEAPKPDPTFVASAELRPDLEKVRNFMKHRMLRDQEPSVCGSVMQHPPFVEVTGQLFYDDSHVGDAHPRGKKGMHAATLWELHPVVAMKFAPKPKP